jgi:hypothetical protein
MIIPTNSKMPNARVIVRSHIVMYCIRQKVYGQVFSPHQLTNAQHLDHNIMHYAYLTLVPLTLLYLAKDLKTKKSFGNLKKYKRHFVRATEFLILLWFLIFVQDIDNAF